MGFDCVSRCWRYLVLALMLYAGNAAAYTAVGTYNVDYYGLGGSGSTPEATCASLQAAYNSAKWGTLTFAAQGEEFCRASNGSSAAMWYAATCDANSVKSGNTCTCKTGFIESGNSCVADDRQAKKCQELKGTEAAFSAGTKKYPPQLEFCVGGTVAGCGASFTKAYGKEADGVMQHTWIGSYTGAKCGAVDNDVKPSECKGTWGNINGVNVCLLGGTDPAATTSTKSVEVGTKTTTGSGTGSGTGTGSGGGTGTGSGDGTTTTTKETTCDGSKCSTTTTKTTTGTDGTSTTETSTEDKPKTTFCEDNPQSQLCVKSVVGGSCAQMTCEGDAIQCAIAKDQLKRNCEAFDKDTDSGSITNKALSGADKLNTDEMKAAAKTGAVQVGSFDTNGRSWSRSCPADPVITIPWAKGNATQWAIPFSRLCSPLQLLANAAVAITLLGSLAWVVGGSKAAA